MKTRGKHQNQIRRSRHYWVYLIVVITVIFVSCKTETSIDHLPDIHGPGIASTNPEPGSIGFPIVDVIRVEFSEDLEVSTVNQDSMSLSVGSNGVPGSLDISGRILTFTSDTSLEKVTTYTATVNREIRDTSGNKMARAFTWSFTTGPVVPIDGLIAHYPFNGNANDESGNGNNGSVNGAILTANRNGNPNDAYNFDGINDYIEIANDALFELTNSITISAWVKNPTETGVIVGKCDYQPGGTCNFELYTANGGSFGFHFYQYGYWHRVQSTTIISDNTWHHIAATYNRSRIVIYLDAIENNSASNTTSMKANGERLQIGQKKSSWPFDYYKGGIDDIRIYNRALSADEILALFYE